MYFCFNFWTYRQEKAQRFNTSKLSKTFSHLPKPPPSPASPPTTIERCKMITCSSGRRIITTCHNLHSHRSMHVRERVLYIIWIGQCSCLHFEVFYVGLLFKCYFYSRLNKEIWHNIARDYTIVLHSNKGD